MKKIAISALAALMAMTTGYETAFAAPVVQPIKPALTGDVEAVQYHHRRHGWYGGHRGYRSYRHGYRRHSDGWWYPLAAFGAGAIIGGAISNERRTSYEGINPRHYDWCYARYRSYRSSDNTYVPRAGYRAECLSPYY